MAVALMAVLMGTLQGCGSDVLDGTITTGCSSSVVNSCISAFDNAKALQGDCSEITTFLDCFAACCDYDLTVNPPTATTIDGVTIDVSLGSSAIEYWSSQATQYSCDSTVSCGPATTVTAGTTVTMTATTTATATTIA